MKFSTFSKKSHNAIKNMDVGPWKYLYILILFNGI